MAPGGSRVPEPSPWDAEEVEKGFKGWNGGKQNLGYLSEMIFVVLCMREKHFSAVPGMSNAFEGSPWDAEKSREGVHGMARREHGSRISERNDFCGLCKGE